MARTGRYIVEAYDAAGHDCFGEMHPTKRDAVRAAKEAVKEAALYGYDLIVVHPARDFYSVNYDLTIFSWAPARPRSRPPGSA